MSVSPVQNTHHLREREFRRIGRVRDSLYHINDRHYSREKTPRTPEDIIYQSRECDGPATDQK